MGPAEREAFVLAGGQSSRMGRNKALLRLGRGTLLGRVLEVARQLAGRVALVANDPQPYAGYGCEVFPDRWPGEGPLNGIGTALGHTRGERALLLSCDLPLVRAELLSVLWELSEREGWDVVLPETADGRLHPLTAVYTRRCLEPIERCLAEGHRRVIAFHDKVRVLRFDQRLMRRHGLDPAQLTNMNTPEDYQRVLEQLESGG